METVLVQVPSPDGGLPSQVVHVQPGQTLSFGRGGPNLDVDIKLAGQGVSRLAGELTAAEDYWLITNLSAEASYVVDNPEGGGEYITVAPRRIAAPVPFEFARVSLPTRERRAEFLVFAPQHAYAEPGASLGGDRTVAAFSLDETAKYFLILVALCEPRLRDAASVALPTAGEIVERLRGRLELTRAAVNHHVDYLAIEKLRVKAPEPGRLDSKREALVAIALRYGIVRDEHRRLLPRRAA
jgi:serine/threonine-protein kinase